VLEEDLRPVEAAQAMGVSRRYFLQGMGAGTALGILSAESMAVSPGSLPTTQAINLSGTVLDIKSGVPLPGVEVSLAAAHVKAITDEQGRFTIFRAATPISDDKHTLQLSRPGYLDLGKPLDRLDHTGLVVEMGKQSEFEGGWAKVPGILAAIAAPRFPDRDFPVTEYGANSSGSGNNHMAFKRAVEACNSAGGGRVVVPEGSYRMEGPIHLLSNVNLHLQRGAKLDFYWNPDGYLVGDEQHQGRIPVRWEGTWLYGFSPLIYAWKQKNIGLTGYGEIDGNGLRPDWPDHGDKASKNGWAHAGVPVDERIVNDLTPGTIEFYFCENVLLENFTSMEPNERNVHPVMCSNVTIRGLNILPSNAVQKEDDGIDPDSCQYVLIEDCRIHSYDDNIGIKAGRDNDGWIKEIEDPEGKWYQEIAGRPSRNILIRNNWFHGGDHNMVGIGSDQSGGVEDVFAWDCQIGQVSTQDNVLEIKANGNRGGEVHNIYVRDIEAKNLKWVLTVNHNYSPRSFAPDGPQNLPRAHHIYIENVTVQNGGLVGFVFKGDDNEPLHDFYFRNISMPEGETARYSGVRKETITAINVTVNGQEWHP
jgi:polygalacturonase